MKKTFIVCLDIVSRQARPPFGKFGYMPAHRRLVWRREEITDISRLAEIVNEASTFLRSYTGTNSAMLVEEVIPVEIPEYIAPVEEAPAAPEPEEDTPEATAADVVPPEPTAEAPAEPAEQAPAEPMTPSEAGRILGNGVEEPEDAEAARVLSAAAAAPAEESAKPSLRRLRRRGAKPTTDEN